MFVVEARQRPFVIYEAGGWGGGGVWGSFGNHLDGYGCSGVGGIKQNYRLHEFVACVC